MFVLWEVVKLDVLVDGTMIEVVLIGTRSDGYTGGQILWVEALFQGAALTYRTLFEMKSSKGKRIIRVDLNSSRSQAKARPTVEKPPSV